jgi:hypothetical protein
MYPTYRLGFVSLGFRDIPEMARKHRFSPLEARHGQLSAYLAGVGQETLTERPKREVVASGGAAV